MAKLAPSILSADFSCLGSELNAMRQAGADYVHVDIMDGHFVPNLSMGFPVVQALRKQDAGMPLDVHLMIEKPIQYAARFCEAGADILTVHVEADSEENIKKTLRIILENGVHPAICVKPKTPAEAVLPFLSMVDLILVMTVEPGFGGQSFMADMMPKVRQIRTYIDAQNPDCELEVDGGVNLKTAELCKESGANVLVAGSAFFGAPDRMTFAAAIRK